MNPSTGGGGGRDWRISVKSRPPGLQSEYQDRLQKLQKNRILKKTNKQRKREITNKQKQFPISERIKKKTKAKSLENHRLNC